mmetsp:Transcript_13075/g.30542  ORF Transcript_13075/g.30542 Transcript_13075/m.30542 type:complete len:529 (-) Transcript_13075:145-1731(-)
MPLYEEKLISPLAILYSQARIRPTFQDGRELLQSTKAIEAVECDIVRSGSPGYSLLLQAPFPPIEVVRISPDKSDKERWITFDNRRLCCLQRAAAAHWPRLSAVVVRVLYDFPVEKHAARKMAHTAAGRSVNICRLYDESHDTWDWMAQTKSSNASAEASKKALAAVRADADSDWHQLPDLPASIPVQRPQPQNGPTSAADLFNLARRWEAESKWDGAAPPGLKGRREDNQDASAPNGNDAGNPPSRTKAGQEILSMLHGTKPGSDAKVDAGQDILAMLQKPAPKAEENLSTAGANILAMIKKPLPADGGSAATAKVADAPQDQRGKGPLPPADPLGKLQEKAQPQQQAHLPAPSALPVQSDLQQQQQQQLLQRLRMQQQQQLQGLHPSLLQQQQQQQQQLSLLQHMAMQQHQQQVLSQGFGGQQTGYGTAQLDPRAYAQALNAALEAHACKQLVAPSPCPSSAWYSGQGYSACGQGNPWAEFSAAGTMGSDRSFEGQCWGHHPGPEAYDAAAMWHAGAPFSFAGAGH